MYFYFFVVSFLFNFISLSFITVTLSFILIIFLLFFDSLLTWSIQLDIQINLLFIHLQI